MKKRNSLRLPRAAILLTIVSLFLLASCGGGGTAGQNATPSTGHTPVPLSIGPGVWVVMGSSTAAGTRATPGKKWSDLLQISLAGHGANFVNIARPGAVTYEGLSASTPKVPNRPVPDPAINIDQAFSKNPIVLLLAFPTNDTVAGYSVDEVVNNLFTIRNSASAKGVSVLVLSTQPRNIPTEQLLQLQQIDTRLAAEVGPCFVNVHRLLAGPDDHLLPAYDSGDGIHPNDNGHEVIANALLSTINSGTCFKLSN
jgi:lysophospholipase L1-like esterase